MATRIIILILVFVNFIYSNMLYIEVPKNEMYDYTIDSLNPVVYIFKFKESSNVFLYPTRYILGNVFENTSYFFSPVVKNLTQKEMFFDLKVSCGCTELFKDTLKVLSNEEKDFLVKFNSTGYPKGDWIRKSVFLIGKDNTSIGKNGKLRFFYEAAIGFEKASLIPKEKEIVFYSQKAPLNIRNISKKRINYLGFYTTLNNEKEFIKVDSPKEFPPGESKLIIYLNRKPNKDILNTLTIYGEFSKDSICIFSVPIRILKNSF